MKKKLLTLFLVALILTTTVFASGCVGCFSDTTTSGTSYDIMMVGNLPYTYDENGVKTYDQTKINGAVWTGIKAYCNTQANGPLYKYFAPGVIKTDDSTPYLTAEKTEYKTQMQLAINSVNKNNAKPVIVLTGEKSVGAFTEMKDSFDDIRVLVTDASPLSSVADEANVTSKTYVMITDYLAQGYASGYTAVMAGNTNIGFLGYDDAKTKALLEGMIQGAGAAAAEKGLSEGSVNVKYAYATRPDDSVNATKLFENCEIVMAETEELEETLISNCGDKSVIGISTKTDACIKFSYYVSATKYAELVQNALLNSVLNLSKADTDNVLGIADGLFKYYGADGFEFDGESLLSEIETKQSSETPIVKDTDISKITSTYVVFSGIGA